MVALIGYADRLSVRPGQTIQFKVSNASGQAVSDRLVRVICADPNPAGPGILEEAVPATLSHTQTPGAQTSRQGSYAIIDAGVHLSQLTSFTIIATVCPTLIGGVDRAVIAAFSPGLDSGVGLAIFKDGSACGALAKAGGGIAFVSTGTPVAEQQWVRLWLSYDAARDEAEIGQQPLAIGRSAGAPIVTRVKIGGLAPMAGNHILIASSQAEGRAFPFNGRIENPMIFDRGLTIEEIESAATGHTVPGLAAAWDFSKDISSDRIIDTGPHSLHGVLINAPTRAMTGSNWTGREMAWRHAPGQYGAIHFHEDDLAGCLWPTTHAWTVPEGTRSGAYALRLEAGEHAENIPFFVVPPKGKPKAKLANLVSTYTYTIYANHARPEWSNAEWRKLWLDRTKAWGGYPHNPGAHREFGLSTYNFHTDGSGIALSSWHRPMLNLRIGYLTYPLEEMGSGLRHFPADTHLFAWLEAKGYDYDVITDDELHHEGLDVLAGYTCVMTGTHPEYHTREMLDALAAYRDQGGRFMYMGGNGFYWKVALDPMLPGNIEIRRGEGGIRAWAAEPGEYYNQFDGEYGGLWRRNGRPPQQLTGVGFTAQGNFVGSYYRRRPAAADPRAAWMFAGVEGDMLGDFGLSGGGAAGFELDRTDKRLGTPTHALVVASSQGHRPETPWVLVPEEHLTHITTIPGLPQKDLIRADLTFFETAAGKGAVFSTGSITYCGSLPHNNFDNSISKLTQNVLDRFLDARPFQMPG